MRAIEALLDDLGVAYALSARRRQVAAHLILGRGAGEIARELNLAYSTVRNHMITIYRHFEVGGQPELMALLLLPHVFGRSK